MSLHSEGKEPYIKRTIKKAVDDLLTAFAPDILEETSILLEADEQGVSVRLLSGIICDLGRNVGIDALVDQYIGDHLDHDDHELFDWLAEDFEKQARLLRCASNLRKEAQKEGGRA